MDQPMLYAKGFDDLPITATNLLPKSFSSLEINESMLSSTPDLVHSVLGFVLMIKLMISGHPESKPYFQEICRNVYPNRMLDVSFDKLNCKSLKKIWSYDPSISQDCEQDLHRSLERYNMLNTETEEAGAKIDLFNEVLDDSVFVANKISEGSEDSDNLVTSICLNVRGKCLIQSLE